MLRRPDTLNFTSQASERFLKQSALLRPFKFFSYKSFYIDEQILLLAMKYGAQLREVAVAGKIVGGRITGNTTIKNTRAFSLTLPVNANNKGAPVFNRYGEVIGIATKSLDGQSVGLAWPSDLIASLKHLGEPGVGAGMGEGPQFGVSAAPSNTDNSTVTRVDTKPVPLSRPTPRYTESARANGIQGSVLVRVLVGEDGNVRASG